MATDREICLSKDARIGLDRNAGAEPLAFWHQRRGSTGGLGKSVIVSDTAHHDFDRDVRDKHLRSYVSEAGLGALLFLHKYQDRANHFHDRQDYSEGLLRELRPVRTD